MQVCNSGIQEEEVEGPEAQSHSQVHGDLRSAWVTMRKKKKEQKKEGRKEGKERRHKDS